MKKCNLAKERIRQDKITLYCPYTQKFLLDLQLRVSYILNNKTKNKVTKTSRT